LAQRQPLPQQETPTPLNTPTINPLPVKQQQSSTVPPKIADLIKGKISLVLYSLSNNFLVLPSSQVAVTELMSALDAFPLSTDELDIIMHKIANKQSVLKQDWNKVRKTKKNFFFIDFFCIQILVTTWSKSRSSSTYWSSIR